MRAHVLLGLALWVIPPTFATCQQVRLLSLRECLELALESNLDIQIQHVALQVSRFDVRAAYGPYDPLLTLSAEHHFVSDPADFDARKFNPYFATDLNTDTLGPALAGKVPIGLSYNFQALGREDNARTDFSGDLRDSRLFPGGIRETNNYFVNAGLTVQQHLLRDFWIDADRERLQVRRKELNISEQALRFEVLKTLLAVEIAYDDVVVAVENIRVQEKAVELRKQLLAETRRRVELGDLPFLDSEQTQTQLQNSLTALVGAREELVTRQNELKALLSDRFREWVDADLRPSDLLQAVPLHLDRAECFAVAEHNRPDLAEARLAVQRSDVTVRFCFNQLFPSLDIAGGFGGIGVETDPGGAINSALGFHNPDYFYGAVLTVPLSRVSERAGYQRSKAARQIAELQLKKAEQEVLLQVANQVNRVESRQAQLASTHQARVYAEAALAAEQKKLLNGYSTSFVVLQLQEILTAARTAEIQALADYNKAQAQLAFAEGTTLERHHLTLEIK